MDDRRKEDRKKMMAFTPVYDAHHRTILGYLGDLTMKGTMVISTHALETGTRMTLAIEFPGDLEGVAVHAMIMPAQVARCVPDESPDSFKIGFEFLNIDPEHAKMIQALLDRYHFRHQMDMAE